MENTEKTYMSTADAGRKGGKRTSERHGKEHYQKIGSMGGQKVKEKHGKEFYSRIGKMHGRKNLRTEDLEGV